MKRSKQLAQKLVLGGIVFLGLASIAQACPVNVPSQTVTVVNQAGVRLNALNNVERAVSRQSLQLRAAWGTSCVKFGSGGWKLYLRRNWPGATFDGIHSFSPGGTDNVSSFPDTGPSEVWGPPNIPFAIVLTSRNTYDLWSSYFDHEVGEMMVNPYGTRIIGNSLAEVFDPVDTYLYEVGGGVTLEDFVFPAYFNPKSRPPYDLLQDVRMPLSNPSDS